ncbi:MAG: CRISPR-associated endonuclease Cas3'' [Tepidanaerobacteraceae bacterium]|nr:CRISPR-associated endonuclease Cas3'' [Tepidanaerobacteraceae bacterium]
MFDLIPFEQCIARPQDEDKINLLKQHLTNVKKFMEEWLKDDDPTLIKLMGLSGVCHDICKAHINWQKYIRNKAGSGKGPSHAPPGAYLFSLLAYKLLKANNLWEKYNVYWLLMTRDIADHHGQLKRLTDDNWIKSWDWSFMDIAGIEEFLKEQYPELQDIDLSETVFEQWMDKIDDLIEEALEALDVG